MGRRKKKHSEYYRDEDEDYYVYERYEEEFGHLEDEEKVNEYFPDDDQPDFEDEFEEKDEYLYDDQSEPRVQTPKIRVKKKLLVPREYQLEMLEKAKAGNVIAYLEPGAGKMLIATMLMESRLPIIRRDDQNLVIIFLAPTYSLAVQQKHAIMDNSDLVAGVFVGGTISCMATKQWQREMDYNDVFVMTPEVLLQCLTHRSLSLSSVDLLVFDECDLAQKNHPYVKIMNDFYCQLAPEDKPRIFGMMSSPPECLTISSKKELDKKLAALERTLDSKIERTVDSFGHPVQSAMGQETLLLYEPLTVGLEIAAQLDELKTQIVDKLNKKEIRTVAKSVGGSIFFSEVDLPAKSIRRASLRARDHLMQLGKFGAFKACGYMLQDLRRLSWQIRTVRKYKPSNLFLKPALGILECEMPDWYSFETSVTYQLKRAMAGYERKSEMIAKARTRAAVQRGLVSPKVETLILELLKRAAFIGNWRFRCVIFVERGFTAKALSRILGDLLRGYLSCTYASSPQVEGTSLVKEFRQIKHETSLQRFKLQQVNILVCTDIVEDGLDLGMCHAVVRFDLSPTFRSHLRSKKFVQAPGAKLYILAQRNSEAHMQLLDRLAQTEYVLSPNHVDDQEEDEEKYTVEASGSSVGMRESVKFVTEFCHTLDLLGSRSPIFEFEEEDGIQFKATVTLPHFNSPDPQIMATGESSSSKATAKHSACLAVIRQLHLLGHLDDSLKPIHGNDCYRVPGTGAMIDASHSIQFLHTYCSRLPYEDVATTRPEFITEEVEGGGFVVEVRLPPCAPTAVQVVVGPVRRGRTAARRAAAIEAIRLLHELGELTNKLLPRKYGISTVAPEVAKRFKFRRRPELQEGVQLQEQEQEQRNISVVQSALRQSDSRGLRMFSSRRRFSFLHSAGLTFVPVRCFV